MENKSIQKPSNAFIAASWVALLTGMLAYIIGLWNAEMELNEKGYYFTVLMSGFVRSNLVAKSGTRSVGKNSSYQYLL